MTDPNQPPATPPSNNPASSTPPPAPAYGQPAAPQYGQPAAPQYGQAPAYGEPVYGDSPQPYGSPAAGPDKYNVLAIVSLVTAFFFQIVAVITGHIALSQIKKTGEKGRGLAIAGLVIGYLGLLLSLIFFALFIPALIAIFNDPNFVNEMNNLNEMNEMNR